MREQRISLKYICRRFLLELLSLVLVQLRIGSNMMEIHG